MTADLDAPPADTADGWLRLHLLSHRLCRAELDLPRRAVRRAHQRRVDLAGPVRRRGLRADPGADAGARHGAGVRRRQVPADDRLRRAVAGCASPMPTGCGSAPTSPAAPRSCTRGSSTSTPAPSARSMVEGRISQGVVVGDGSDIGGGASTMGTLSGGGTERVSIGERCLLGAESGLGIALGDDCVVEAGLYVTAGTKVTLPDGTVTKARELSGQSNLLFLRNSVTGAVRGASARRARHRAQLRAPRQRLTRAHRDSPPTTPKDTDRMPRTPRGAITLAEEQPRTPRHRRLVAGLVVVVLGVVATAAVLGVRHLRALVSGEQCLVTASGYDLRVGARPGEQRRRDHGHRRAARDAAARRDDRDRHRDAGVEGAQRQVRRPRLARAVPAAALAGLGHRRADPRPRVLDEQVLRRPREDQGLRSRWTSPRPPRRCSGRRPARPTPSTRPRRG